MAITWLLKETILAIHQTQVLEHGGLYGIRDMTLLESALACPMNKYAYADAPITLPQLAASYAFAISSNHPFIDGNKRVALVASYTFLHLNGFQMTASEIDSVGVFLKLAANEITEDALTLFLTTHSRPQSLMLS